MKVSLQRRNEPKTYSLRIRCRLNGTWESFFCFFFSFEEFVSKFSFCSIVWSSWLFFRFFLVSVLGDRYQRTHIIQTFVFSWVELRFQEVLRFLAVGSLVFSFQAFHETCRSEEICSFNSKFTTSKSKWCQRRSRNKLKWGLGDRFVSLILQSSV
jgi:hypothetical protein